MGTEPSASIRTLAQHNTGYTGLLYRYCRQSLTSTAQSTMVCTCKNTTPLQMTRVYWNRPIVAAPDYMQELKQAMVYKQADWILVAGHGRIMSARSVITQEELFTQAWNIDMEYIRDMAKLVEAFCAGHTVAVSNGSYMEMTGAATYDRICNRKQQDCRNRIYTRSNTKTSIKAVVWFVGYPPHSTEVC